MAEVNSEKLDELVSAYLGRHNGQDDACASAAASAEELRQMLLGGAFAAAADRLRQLSPPLADNQWLEFQMKRHQFTYLAREAAGGSSKAQAGQLQAALDLAKRELAPLALHAYCEAYADFKHCMLALVTGGDAGVAGGSSTGSSSSSASAELQEFAGMVVRAVRQETGFEVSQLPQLLRYLLLLHHHQHHSGFHPYWWPEISQPTVQLCERLLLPQRDALPSPALEPTQGGSLSAGGVREHDAQALRTSLGCDREEAVTLLRRARGSAFRGLQDALQAAHIDEGLLHELASEYAACRGLEQPPPPQQQQEQQQQEEQQQEEEEKKKRQKQTLVTAGTAADAADVAMAEGGATQQREGGIDEMQLDQQQQEEQAVRQQQQQQQQRPSKVARLGPVRPDSAGQAAAPPAAGAAAGEECGQQAEDREQQQLLLPAELSEKQLLCLLRQLEHLLAAGHADQALEQLPAADPSFLPDHPAAAFALHRCRFLHLLAPGSGGVAAALAYVRQHLSPLAQQHPGLLQPQLKAVLATLLPLPAAGAAAGGGGGSGGGRGGGGDDGDALAAQQQQGVADALTAVRAALRPRCRACEPRLLSLLRELLSLHTAHFKLQRCQDRFAAELGITALKAAAAASNGAAGGAAAGPAAPAGAAAIAAAAAAAVAAEAGQALAAAAAVGGQRERGLAAPFARQIVERRLGLIGDASEADEDMHEGSDSDGDGHDDDGGDGGGGDNDVGVPEQAIITVCEFTGLPRHTAIELLLAHDGDAAAVLAHVFP